MIEKSAASCASRASFEALEGVHSPSYDGARSLHHFSSRATWSRSTSSASGMLMRGCAFSTSRTCCGCLDIRPITKERLSTAARSKSNAGGACSMARISSLISMRPIWRSARSRAQTSMGLGDELRHRPVRKTSRMSTSTIIDGKPPISEHVRRGKGVRPLE